MVTLIGQVSSHDNFLNWGLTALLKHNEKRIKKERLPQKKIGPLWSKERRWILDRAPLHNICWTGPSGMVVVSRTSEVERRTITNTGGVRNWQYICKRWIEQIEVVCLGKQWEIRLISCRARERANECGHLKARLWSLDLTQLTQGGEHLYILAMASGERERQDRKCRLCLRRVLGSEETIAVKLVWADDGWRNFKRMVGGPTTKNQEGVVIGVKETWPDLVLRYI